MNILTTIFWLLAAHFMADYPLQTPEMGKYKNKKNQPTPPDKDAKPVRVWFAYLTAHAFIHAGLSALVLGAPLGFLIGLVHWIQDYYKCKIQYSPNLDQIIHISILILIAVIFN
jgi:ABC-type nitrate/sulfonate/bicarbonate transport system permease component